MKKVTCANCGKRARPEHLTPYEGQWWCPGACDVTRGFPKDKHPKDKA